jgi:hypothetical protein
MWDQLCLATETNGVFLAETLTQAEQGAAVAQAISKCDTRNKQKERNAKKMLVWQKCPRIGFETGRG